MLLVVRQLPAGPGPAGYRLPRRAGLINQTPTLRNDAYAMTSRRSVLQCVVYEKQTVWTP